MSSQAADLAHQLAPRLFVATIFPMGTAKAATGSSGTLATPVGARCTSD
jgi:hypothetical protein